MARVTVSVTDETKAAIAEQAKHKDRSFAKEGGRILDNHFSKAKQSHTPKQEYK